jgi:predicted aldo/keto reductase-like oxidoreductase
MQYRINPKNGDALSALGFGCMRLPRDEGEAARQIVRAVELGVNYFDTAYVYPGSEARLGRILSKGLRDKVKLATKLPPYRVARREDLDKIFHTELERLQTDWIDYYLLHMLPDAAAWRRLAGLGIVEWVREKKANGQIRNFGFSFHGGTGDFTALIDAFDWDFCMIQYNYLDEHNQAGKAGLSYAAGKGLAVMIMEPLRGGQLATRLPKQASDVWANAAVPRSPAEWGLRWVWNHPEVTVVLSGMNTMESVEENARAASDAAPDSLSPEELGLYERAKAAILAKTNVPCTGCRYCMPCPQGVDIPLCFNMYNELALGKRIMTRFWYVFTVREHNASRCVGCGVCETHCPQKIAIRAELAATAKSLERGVYKPLRAVVRRVMRLP